MPPNATLLLIAIAFIALAVSSPALAQSCSVTNASGSYGSINVLSGAAVNTTSTFTVTCSGKKNNTVRLCIEMSAGSPTDAGKRALSNGAKFLDHEFYSDASRTQVWGSWGAVVTAYGSGGVTYDLLLNSSGSASHTFTLYARVLANQQTAAPLAYSWSATSPGTKYGYLGTSSCPTGGSSTNGGSTVWTATVATNCAVSATGINFGSSGAITSNVDATGSVTVQCTNATPYTVALNGGNSGASDPTKRKMAKGGRDNHLRTLPGHRPHPTLGQHLRHQYRRGHRHRLQSSSQRLWPGCVTKHTFARNLYRLRSRHSDVLMASAFPIG